MLFHTIAAVFQSGLQGTVEWFFGDMSPAERVGMVAGAVTALAGGFLAWNQRKTLGYERRIENLKKIVYSTRSERYIYVKRAREYYCERDVDSGRELPWTLYREDWLQPDGDDNFPELADVEIEIEDTLWDSRKNHRPRFLPTPAEGYAENVKFHCNDNLMNRPLYALQKVQVEPAQGNRAHKVKLRLKKGRYFDFYDTCEVLLAEMAYEWRIRHRNLDTNDAFPLRQKNGDPFRLDGRFAGVGVNALTILRNVRDEETGETHSYFILHSRSGTSVAEGCGCLHVVPAGSHQPAEMDFKEETDKEDCNLACTVVREFQEELLGKGEFENMATSKLLEEPDAYESMLGKIYFLGICLEPVNTKAEVLACLMIDVNASTVFVRHKTVQSIGKHLKNNYEGSYQLKPLVEKLVDQYKKDPSSTPSFAQIMEIVQKHPDFFGVEQGSAASGPSQD